MTGVVTNIGVDHNYRPRYIYGMDTIPLRARKLARSRLALLDAFVARMDERPVEEISVRELCAAAEVSEATFFNHFAGKDELVVFFIQLWALEVGWRARRVLAERGALAAIEGIFADTAASVAAHPRVMGEVLAAQARLDHEPPVREVTFAERRLRFPDLDGVETLPSEGLDALLPWLLGEAVARGELPPDTDVRTLFLHLAAFFFGTPIVLRRIQPALVGPAWQAQLALLWAAAPKVRS